MSKHTSGPWQRVGSIVKSVGNQEKRIADVKVTNEEGQANARLIAAAPDLLEAAEHCRELLMSYEINRINGDEIAETALAKLNAAISKATA